MSKKAFYYAWEPSIESGGTVISVFLTRGRCREAPDGGKEFFENILLSVGIEKTLKFWRVEPFITRYYNSKKWKECWDARLTINGKVKISASSDVRNVPIFELPTTKLPLTEYFPVRVLANFCSRQAAIKCRESLRQFATTVKWNEVHFERYFIRNIGKRQKQLLVDVVTTNQKGLTRAIKAAEKTEDICKDAGGIIRSHLINNFDR